MNVVTTEKNNAIRLLGYTLTPSSTNLVEFLFSINQSKKLNFPTGPPIQKKILL